MRSIARSLLSASVGLLLLLAFRGLVDGGSGADAIVSAHADRKLEGAALFGSSGCTHCHGAEGAGTDQGPSLRDVRKKLKPEQIAEQIRHGGKEMPAFADSLNEEQIGALVAFVDAKKWGSVPAAPSASTP